VLVADNAVVFQRQIVEANPDKHLILRCPGPGIDDGHLTRCGLTNDQVVNRDLTKVEAINRWIEPNDVSIGWIDDKDPALTVCRHGRRLWAWLRCWLWRRQWCRLGRWLNRGRAIIHARDHHVFEHGSGATRRGTEAKADRTASSDALIPARTTNDIGRAVAAENLSVPDRTDVARKVERHIPAFKSSGAVVADSHLTGEARAPIADNTQVC